MDFGLVLRRPIETARLTGQVPSQHFKCPISAFANGNFTFGDPSKSDAIDARRISCKCPIQPSFEGRYSKSYRGATVQKLLHTRNAIGPSCRKSPYH